MEHKTHLTADNSLHFHPFLRLTYLKQWVKPDKALNNKKTYPQDFLGGYIMKFMAQNRQQSRNRGQRMSINMERNHS